MIDLVFLRAEQASSVSSHRDIDRNIPISAPVLRRRLEDRQFCLMERAFRPTGGLVGGDEVVRLLRRRSDQPISMLARWIVSREALSIEWHARTLLPLFQFKLADMNLRPEVTTVLRELSDVYDDWGVALWFANPNAWLDHSAPVDVMGRDAGAVMDAARADRFVVRG